MFLEILFDMSITDKIIKNEQDKNKITQSNLDVQHYYNDYSRNYRSNIVGMHSVFHQTDAPTQHTDIPLLVSCLHLFY